MLVQAGTGFNIINDMLSITNATPTQISVRARVSLVAVSHRNYIIKTALLILQKAFQSSVRTTSSTPASLPNSPQAGVAAVDAANGDELSRKRELVTALAMQTGMNLMWAEK